jgi:hypothetical protein
MELIEVACANCHNTLLIQAEHVRVPMFCTLGCMSSFEEDRSSQNMRD